MKKLISIFLAILLVTCAFAACGAEESLEERVAKDCNAMVQAVQKQDFEQAMELLHPVTGEEQQSTEMSLQTLLKMMEGKRVKSVVFDAPEMTERAENEWLIKGTGTITLADDSQMTVQYTYLSDGSEGFVRFTVKEITE